MRADLCWRFCSFSLSFVPILAGRVGRLHVPTLR